MISTVRIDIREQLPLSLRVHLSDPLENVVQLLDVDLLMQIH